MKDLITSKTIIGLLLAVLGPAAARYGIDAGTLQSSIEILTQAGGALLTVYGRITASKQITSIAGIKINQGQ